MTRTACESRLSDGSCLTCRTVWHGRLRPSRAEPGTRQGHQATMDRRAPRTEERCSTVIVLDAYVIALTIGGICLLVSASGWLAASLASRIGSVLLGLGLLGYAGFLAFVD